MSNIDMSVQIEQKIKNEMNNIDISSRLDEAIASGIAMGKADMAKMDTTQKSSRQSAPTFILRIAASLAIMLLLSGIAGNLSAPFAEAVERIPVVGRIVRLLIFVDHQTGGGVIDDGINLDTIETDITETGQSFYIHFSSGGTSTELASAYTIVHSQSPTVLSFTVHGVRMTDMVDDFEALRMSPYIQDIYTVMSLDDSMTRFNIHLEPGVLYEVFEHESPAMLELQVKFDESAQTDTAKTLYAVRTHSYPFSETFAIIEESLFWIEGINYRILKDSEGGFLYEFGRYESLEEAQSMLDALEVPVELIVVEENADLFSIHSPLPASDRQDNKKGSDVQPPADQTEEVNQPLPSFPVSITYNSEVISGQLQLSDTDLIILDMEGNLLKSIPYQGADYEKVAGEASFILNITTAEEQWSFGGVFSDFFEALEQYYPDYLK